MSQKQLIVFFYIVCVCNFKAVFERLVDIICDKMSESLDSDPNLVTGGPKGQRLTDPPQAGPTNNCNC